MTTEANRELISRIFSRLSEGDGSLFVESLSDDVVMRVTGSYSWSQTFKGKSTLLKQLYGHVASVTTGVSKTIPDNIIADGEYVAVEAHGEMTAKDGHAYNNEYCLVYRVESGEITEIREYQDSTLCEAILGPFPSKQAGT